MGKSNQAPPEGGISGFAAYIPSYDGGNSVTAVKKDGQAVLINKGIKSVINEILKESSINISFLRKNFSRYIGGTNLIPIPLKLGTVLIPVKARKAIGKYDGSYAYIDLADITDVIGDKSTVIKLKCGSIINCLETVKTVEDRIKKGKLIEDKFTLHMMREYSFKEGLTDISSEYDKAATKGDITMLAYEIMKLRNSMSPVTEVIKSLHSSKL